MRDAESNYQVWDGNDLMLDYMHILAMLGGAVELNDIQVSGVLLKLQMLYKQLARLDLEGKLSFSSCVIRKVRRLGEEVERKYVQEKKLVFLNQVRKSLFRRSLRK